MILKFSHTNLELVKPDFGATLTDLIFELESLKRKEYIDEIHPKIHQQLKEIFKILESVSSAYIDGNNTSIIDFIEGDKHIEEDYLEISDIKNSISFINKHRKELEFQQLFINNLHKRSLKEIKPFSIDKEIIEPKLYRNNEVTIANTLHKPPPPLQVVGYMDELFKFISQKDAPKYDLLKTAIAHHRFVWIHPFANGNGKTVRLFTYAMLVKQGFNINKRSIINPSAIFSKDKNLYFKFLSKADTGTKNGMIKWCEYVLDGLKTTIETSNKLLDYSFLSKHILSKAIFFVKELGKINETEFQILQIAIKKQVFQSSDLKVIFKGKHSAEIS